MGKPSRTLEIRMRAAAATAGLLLFASPHLGSAQEVYKSVDADGHVTYSDRGTSKNSPKTSLKVEEGDPAEAARLAKEQDLLKAEDTQRARQDAQDAKTKEAEDRQNEAYRDRDQSSWMLAACGGEAEDAKQNK